jgi:hypothetical protein
MNQENLDQEAMDTYKYVFRISSIVHKLAADLVV